MVNTIFILDQHYQVIKILTVNGKNTFFDDLYSIDLSTGVESFEFSTNVDDLCETHYIMFYYHDQYKLFQITELEQEHSEGKIITYCYGESACLELLNGVVQANDFGGKPVTCIEFIKYVLQGTDWQIGRYSGSLDEKMMSQLIIDRTSQRWTLIQDYMGEFGYEINTRVIYENGFIRAKLIDVYADGELGEKTYKRFQYGRNVDGIVKKKDLYEWCTALIIDSSEDINSIEFEKGAYIKPQGTDIIMAKYENNLYNLGRNFIYSTYEDNSPTPQEAVENAYVELKRRATPRFDYECTTVMTYEEYDDISIGDTVYVIDTSFNPIITLEARVGKLEISFTDRNNCKCNLTNYKEIKSGIDVTLSGSIKEIVDTYFPITGDKIAGETINPENLKEEVYELIRTNYIKAEIGEFDKLIAEKFIAKEAYIGDLGAVNANIENLKAKDAEIENLVVENMNATNANIENLNAINATIKNLEAEDAYIKNLAVENMNAINANIENLNATNATIENLNADFITFRNATGQKLNVVDLHAEKLTAIEAQIKDLDVDDLHASKAEIDELYAHRANIFKLDAAFADIDILQADVADIDTLINGNLSSEHVHSLNIVAKDMVADNATVAEINAAAIIAGSIDTNKVTIHSDDGSMNLTGSLQQFKDENGVVRIQMGKDGQGNFTFGLFDESGEGVILSDQGLGERGLAEGVIVDSHINPDANIPGTKLDIGSIIGCINSGTNNPNQNTISYKKIYVDESDDTLNVVFGEIEKQVEYDANRLTTLETEVSVNAEKIELLMERTEIDDGGEDEGTTLREQVSQLTQTVEGITTDVSELETKYDEVSGKVASVTDKQSTLEQTVDGFKLDVQSNYTTKQELSSTKTELEAKINNASLNITDEQILSVVSKSYYTKTEVDTSIDSLDGKYAQVSDVENLREEYSSQMSQTAEDITMKFNESKYYTKEIQDELINFKEDFETNIKFSTQGIELGKTNSPFKATFDNERLAFFEDGVVVAYISNNRMNATNVSVQNELAIGNYKWVSTSNGHLRLK